MVDMAHFAGLVAAGEHPNPVAHADVVTTTIHKTLCGPRSGMILCREEHAKAIDKAVFPGQQGGPLMHTIAAKAVALRIAASEPFRARQRQTIANAKALAEGLIEGRRPGPHRRHRRPPRPRRPDPHAASMARAPRTASRRSGSPSTATRSPLTRGPPMNPSGLRIGTPALTTPRHGRGGDGARSPR